MRRFAENPEGYRLLAPITAKFLADIGVRQQVDTTTGEVVVDPVAIFKALGLNADEEMEKLGDAVRTVPGDRLKPLQ